MTSFLGAEHVVRGRRRREEAPLDRPMLAAATEMSLRTPVRAMKQLMRWLVDPQHASALWLGKHCVIVAWVGLLIAAISPPHGFGINVCWFSGATGLPCPGCGVTRSLSCGLRGLWLESWHYHPMGLLILGLFGFTAAQSLLPWPTRERIAHFIRGRALWFNTAYLAFVVTFVSFGLARTLSHFSTGAGMP
jgi:hypothetical protein